MQIIRVSILVILTSFLAISYSNVFSTDQEIELNEGSSQDCKNFKRVINPAEESISSETELDRHFRLAFSYETAAEFDQAILHYQQAAKLSTCDCDRLHAEAGERAAKETKKLFEKEGMKAKPTQFFWGRLQELTQTLPCVEIE